jgi:glycosyltransferase involved in cell wall biosynthesis
MRVLVDCRMAHWSGVGRYTRELAGALAVRGDISLVLVRAAGVSSPVLDIARAEVVSASAHPFSLRGALELGRLARQAKPDIVHCPHFPTPAPVRGPLVVTLHDATPLVVPEAMPAAWRRVAYRQLNTRATRVADRLIVPSRSSRADVERLFPASYGKIDVVAEAADTFAAGAVSRLPPRLQSLTAGPFFLAMGSVRPHKDLATLLRAFGALAASRPDVRLLLVGADVPGYVGGVLAAASTEDRARVSFTGHVSDGELRALYTRALAFVFPSRHEGFGLPPLEAMALGVPVMCARAGSLPEVVGDAALLFPPGDDRALCDELRRLLDDPELRRRRADLGRARAAQFTWERTAAATLDSYRAALSHFRATGS